MGSGIDTTSIEFSQVLLDLTREIEHATAGLFRRDEMLRELCDEVKSNLGFDFAAVQLIDKEKESIHCVYGIERAEEWAPAAEHSLQIDPKLFDIQADIALSHPPRLEIIFGQDRRFDDWIYRRFRHHELERVWVPLILVRDREGKIIEDWFHTCRWIPSDENCTYDEGDLVYRRASALLDLDRLGDGYSFERIGTVEAGVLRQSKNVSMADAVKLANLIGYRALDLRMTLLPYVLRMIAESARKIVRADSASLYCFWNHISKRYTHEESRNISAGRLADLAPRETGLGRQAIREKRPKYVPGQDEAEDQLRRSNRAVYDQGIRSMAAFPLLVDPGNEGILYLHYKSAHRFTENELRCVETFAGRAAAAIRHATYDTRALAAARRFANLHAATQSLVKDPEDRDLLRQIAGIALNMLVADVVTIYEYVESERSFPSPPEVAGRLRVEHELNAPTDSQSPPVWLVERGEDVYAEDAMADPLLCRPGRRSAKGAPNFVTREQVTSTAGVRLQLGGEIVGVMFLNYRRPHRLDAEEQRFIQTVASTAAIAINNRRLIRDREIDLLHMTHQLHLPLRSASAALDNLQALPRPDHATRRLLGKVADKIKDALIMSESIFAALTHELGRGPELSADEIEGPREFEELWERVVGNSGREDLRFKCVAEPGTDLILLNRRVFTSVAYSLIDNAIKYSDQESEIFAHWMFHSSSKNISLRMRGTGKPIPPESKEKIFQKFWRVPDAISQSSQTNGVGMGLWMARELMVAVGGRLTVELVPSQSRDSIFVIDFPAAVAR